MKIFSGKIKEFSVLLILLGLLSCGGDNTGNDGSTVSNNPNPIDDTGSLQPPAYTGFDLPLGEGTYWEFSAQHSTSKWSQGGSNYSGTSEGTFRIVLGKPKVIEGETLYAANRVITGGSSGAPKLRWSYLGVQDKNLIGSTNGTNIDIVFDAQNGYQNGGGLFASFSGLTTANVGTLNNPYVDESAIVLSESYDESSCEYFPGVGNVCGGDRNINTTTREYYKPQVGPLGYYYHNSYSFSGGGFSSGGSEEWKIGLTGYSFVGDGYYINPEVTPLSSGDVTIYYGLYGSSTTLARDKYNAITPSSHASKVMRYVYNNASSEAVTDTVPSDTYTGKVILTEGDVLLSLSTFKDNVELNSFRVVDPVTNATLSTATSIDSSKLNQVALGGIAFFDNSLRFVSGCGATSCTLYNQPVDGSASEVGAYTWRHLMTDGIGYYAGLYTPQFNSGSDIVDVYALLEHDPVTADILVLGGFSFQPDDTATSMRDFALDSNAFYFSTVDFVSGQAAVWRWVRSESSASKIWGTTLTGTMPSVMIDADNGWLVINTISETPLVTKSYIYNPNASEVTELNLPGEGVKLNLQIHVVD